MEAWAKIAAGLALLFISLGFLYRPGWILHWNALGRSVLFNDAFVLLYRRRWGLLFFVAAVLFFYSGFNNLAWDKYHDRPAAVIPLSEAYRSFQRGQYKGTVARCQEILKAEPDNVHAWFLLGSAWSALNRNDMAEKAWEQILKSDLNHPKWKSVNRSTSTQELSHH